MIPPRPAWHARANCAGLDPDLFFPLPGTPHADNRAARAVCAGCEVRAECRAAGERELYGFWGGTSVKDRYRERTGAGRVA